MNCTKAGYDRIRKAYPDAEARNRAMLDHEELISA